MGEAGPADRHAAFASYVLPEMQLLYRVALRLTGQAADAEDLVQDTLVRAYRALDRFDGAYPRAWLLTILRNTHVNRGRRQRPLLLRTDEMTVTEVGVVPLSVPSSEEVVLSEQFEAVVVEALATLSDKYRSAVELVDIEGLSYQEAADRLGVPRGTVMSRLHRGRAHIRSRLKATGLARRRKGP